MTQGCGMVCAGVPGTNDATADITERRRPAVPAGWGRVPGHEIAFCDRLPFLLTTEVCCHIDCRMPSSDCQSNSAVLADGVRGLRQGAWL